MGVAAHNRGSRAIASGIEREFSPRRVAFARRMIETRLRATIAQQAREIAKLKRNLLLMRDGKERIYRTCCELDARAREDQRQWAGIIRRLMGVNTRKEWQRLKLARCVREHLTPNQWLAWSAEYDQANAAHETEDTP